MPKIPKSEKLLKHEIIKASDAVRKKYYTLKTGQADETAMIEKTLRPLVEPLNVIAANAGLKPRLKHEAASVDKVKPADNTNIANDSTAWDFESELPEYQDSTYKIQKRTPPMLRKFRRSRLLTLDKSTPRQSQNTVPPSTPLFTPDNINNNDTVNQDDINGSTTSADNGVNNDDDQVFETVYETPDTGSQRRQESPRSALAQSLAMPEKRAEIETMFSENFGTLTKDYIMEFINDTRNKMDTLYGVRYVNDGFMMGDASIKFAKNRLYVKGINFRTTEGLLELMFKKIPDNSVYTSEDLLKYGKIVDITNAHKRGYVKTNQISGNKSYKYTEIIQKLFFPKQRMFSSLSGQGLNTEDLIATNNNIDYTWWDDPNELVDRLLLLSRSELAGHTAHRNEIVSIVEELREAGIIV